MTSPQHNYFGTPSSSPNINLIKSAPNQIFSPSKSDFGRNLTVEEIDELVHNYSTQYRKSINNYGFHFACMYHSINEDSKAQTWLTHFLQSNPNHSQAHRLNAIIHEQHDRCWEALDSYKMSLEIDPNQVDLRIKILELLIEFYKTTSSNQLLEEALQICELPNSSQTSVEVRLKISELKREIFRFCGNQKSYHDSLKEDIITNPENVNLHIQYLNFLLEIKEIQQMYLYLTNQDELFKSNLTWWQWKASFYSIQNNPPSEEISIRYLFTLDKVTELSVQQKPLLDASNSCIEFQALVDKLERSELKTYFHIRCLHHCGELFYKYVKTMSNASDGLVLASSIAFNFLQRAHRSLSNIDKIVRKHLRDKNTTISFIIPKTEIQSTILHSMYEIYETSVISNVCPLQSGVNEEKGKRPTMEDSNTVIDDLSRLDLSLPKSSFYAIFDGHGGTQTSEYLGSNLINFLIQDENFKQGNYEEAFHRTFLRVDQKLKELKYDSGSTAVCVLLLEDGTIYVANVGDSELIIALSDPKTQKYTYQVPTVKHNPTKDNPDEIQRIKASGGYVSDDGRVGGMLAVSRAFGDFPLKAPECGLIVDPHIKKIPPNPDYEFLIIACDGLFEAGKRYQNSHCDLYQETVDMVAALREEFVSPTEIAKRLCDWAIQQGSGDNISVIVVEIKNKQRLSFNSFQMELIKKLWEPETQYFTKEHIRDLIYTHDQILIQEMKKDLNLVVNLCKWNFDYKLYPHFVVQIDSLFGEFKGDRGDERYKALNSPNQTDIQQFLLSLVLKRKKKSTLDYELKTTHNQSFRELEYKYWISLLSYHSYFSPKESKEHFDDSFSQLILFPNQFARCLEQLRIGTSLHPKFIKGLIELFQLLPPSPERDRKVEFLDNLFKSKIGSIQFLFESIRKGDIESVQESLHFKRDNVNVVYQDFTPLHYAISLFNKKNESKCCQIIELLINNGAKLETKIDGKTALQLAEEKRNQKICRLIQQREENKTF